MRPEEKVYQAYFETKKQSLYFNEIKEKTQLSDSSLWNILKKLTSYKILTKTKTKSNTFYEIKNKKIISLKFAEIAIKKFENLNTGVKIPLKEFIKKCPKDIQTIVLFGSASKKQEKKGSDIDLLIVSNQKKELEKIQKEINAISNYYISIFEISHEEFIRNEDHVVVQAKKTGIPIMNEQLFYEVQLNEHR
jgi:predicted nucleotidyltransferase